MNEFLTLQESKEKFINGVSKSASFIAVVVSMGELNSGTSAKGEDWLNKKFTLDDGHSREDITAWNDEIKLLKIGYIYEFNSPYWKDYKGTPQLSLGQYCTVKCIGSEEAQSTLTSTQTTTDDISPAPKGVGSPNGEKLPEPTEQFKEFIIQENLILAQIEQVVVEEITRFKPVMATLNRQQAGMRIKEIYRESKKSNFKAASEK